MRVYLNKRTKLFDAFFCDFEFRASVALIISHETRVKVYNKTACKSYAHNNKNLFVVLLFWKLLVKIWLATSVNDSFHEC